MISVTIWASWLLPASSPVGVSFKSKYGDIAIQMHGISTLICASLLEYDKKQYGLFAAGVAFWDFDAIALVGGDYT
ncbi:MAG: hypothetical protein ACRD5K_18825 [Candidatus Acidiferrales bacterium]